MRAPHGSVWWATLPDAPRARPPLDRDLDVDVAIIGAGYTGLWTAIGLLRHDPRLRVALLEADVAGAGASGRNGGWASALYPQSFERVRDASGDGAMRELRQALRDGVVDLHDDAESEGVTFDYARGGTITLARSEPQVARLRAEVAQAHALGDAAADLDWLGEAAARARCCASEVRGALFTPHCAAVHPAKLATGLAAGAERRGATIYESTRATSIMPGDRWRRPSVTTEHGEVRADVVVRATEGFTPLLEGLRRSIVPLYSLVIATEPLPLSFFDRVGLRARETFTDGRHLIIYGQRTADDRLVFGGRGAPYHLGSRVEGRFDLEPRVFAKLEATLVELFGEVPAAVSHRWGGPIGLARDMSPSVRFDRMTGMASAGGYVGDGVVLSRVAALALADLVCGVETPRAALCFVDHRSRNWEHEPLRWLGINAGLLAASFADHSERLTGRPSVAARALHALRGG